MGAVTVVAVHRCCIVVPQLRKAAAIAPPRQGPRTSRARADFAARPALLSSPRLAASGGALAAAGTFVGINPLWLRRSASRI